MIDLLAVSQFKNGRWKGYRTTGNIKPVQTMGDPTVPYWIETPASEIPRKLGLRPFPADLFAVDCEIAGSGSRPEVFRRALFYLC